MGPVVMMIAVVVPLYNVLAVITLEVFRGNRPKMGHVLLNIVKNPLIIAAALGILCLLTRFRLPGAVESTLRQLSPVSNPLMLFLLGAFFRFDGLRRYWKDLLEVVLGRLVLVPGMALTAAYFLGFRGVVFAGLIAVFGSATAVSSWEASKPAPSANSTKVSSGLAATALTAPGRSDT